MDRRQCLFSIVLVLLVLTTRVHGQKRPLKIGAIFHKGDENITTAFLKAIFDTTNDMINLAFAFELIPVIKYVDGNTNSFTTATVACELLQEGVAAIFGPASRYNRGIVASIAARFDVPHIEYVWRESEGLGEKNKKRQTPSSMTINVFPASEQVSQAIADIIESMKWQKFVAIYETNEGLSRLQKTLALKGYKDNPIRHTVRRLNEGPNYRPMLKEIRSLSLCNIIIDVEPQNIMKVLQQAKEIRLMADYCNFVITYLDSHQLPIVEMRSSTANIIGLSLRENDIENIDWLDSAILYDSVFLLHKALEILNVRNMDNKVYTSVDPIPLSCTNTNRKYQAGRNITSIMRELSKMGRLTGIMNIDEYGHRQDFQIKILDFRQSGIIQTGFWDSSGVHAIRIEEEHDIYVHRSMEKKIFTISLKVSPPFVMEVIDGSKRGVQIDEKYYEGYCIDLMNYIAEFLYFEGVVFEIVPDKQYGMYDPQTKTWNGLIKRILDHKADFVISDLTVTFMRKSVVDFSFPFMSSGIGIVHNEQIRRTDFFSFLSPLSVEVWLCMAIAYFIVSIMLFLQARASSLRMLLSMWWLFSFFMTSSYTANLAAFLTNEMNTPIKVVEDLAKQTKIRYGVQENGSTSTFFKVSNYPAYQQMWARMSNSKPSVFTESNEEGINRIMHDTRYAFLMESPIIEYYMELNCDIINIGNLINNNEGYGIAMPRNSPYRTLINRAILALKEKGTLSMLKIKWWKKEEGLCKRDEAEKNASTKELEFANIKGVFFILICGCSASFFIAICEFLWNIPKVAVREKITSWEALVAELKFVVNIFAVTKPVKFSKKKNSSASSM